LSCCLTAAHPQEHRYSIGSLTAMEEGEAPTVAALRPSDRREILRTAKRSSSTRTIIVGPIRGKMSDKELQEKQLADDLQRRRIRIWCILGLLLVLLGIFVSVVITIISYRASDRQNALLDDGLN
jgi:hypothetical protein